MSCIKCSIKLTTDELGKKIKCDDCKRLLCQNCSKLNATEIRCMQPLGKRMLKFTCEFCEAKYNNNFDFLNNLLEKKVEEMQEQLNTSLKTTREDIKDQFTEVNNQIENLKLSNIDLIRLLTSNNYPNLAEKNLLPKTNQSTKRSIRSKQDQQFTTPRLDIYSPISSKNKNMNSLSQNKTQCNLGTGCSSTDEPNLPTISKKNYPNNTSSDSKEQNDQNTELKKLRDNSVNILSGSGTTDNKQNESDKNHEVNNKNDWQEVNRRRYKQKRTDGQDRKNKISVGNDDTNNNFAKLKVVSRLKWIFISNISSDVTSEDVISCLDEKYKDQYICEKKILANPKIASFKLGVPEHMEQVLLSRTYWPRGTWVDKYNFPKKKTVNYNHTSHEEISQKNGNELQHFLDQMEKNQEIIN